MLNLFESLIAHLSSVSDSLLVVVVLWTFLCDTILVCVGVAIFVMFIWRRNKDVCTKLKKKFDLLPFFKKIWITSFTITFAIPNRIYVYNQLGIVFTGIITAISVALCCIFQSSLLLFVFSVFGLAVQSLLTVTLYKKIPFFRKTINDRMFDNDLEFAHDYFDFFYGNIDKTSKTALGQGGSIFVAAFGVFSAYMKESAFIADETRKRYNDEVKQLNDDGRSLTLNEMHAIRTQNQQDVIEEYAILHKARNGFFGNINKTSEAAGLDGVKQNNPFDMKRPPLSPEDQAVLERITRSDLQFVKDFVSSQEGKPKSTSPIESTFNIESSVLELFDNIFNEINEIPNVINELELNLDAIPIISICLRTIPILWNFRSYYYFKINDYLFYTQNLFFKIERFLNGPNLK